MATIRFYAKPLPNNTVQINALLQHGKDKPAAYTGYRLPSNKVNDKYRYWDAKKQAAKEHDQASAINAKIRKWQSRFTDYIDSCKREGSVPDMYRIKAMLESKEGISGVKAELSKMTLIEAAKAHYTAVKKDLAPGTLKMYATFQEDLKAYEQEKKVKVMVTSVTTEWLKDFGDWLISHSNNYNPTVNVKLGRINTIVKHVGGQPPVKPKYKEVKSNKFALSPSDLDKLRKHNCRSGADQMRLDAFLFGCETTLRHSDVDQLYPYHKKELTIKNRKVPVLDITQIKTTNLNIIALSDRTLELWNKYATKDKTKKVFPLNNSQTSTEALKRICKDAGLTQLRELVKIQGSKVERTVAPLHECIGFHISRNTAITSQLEHLPAAMVMANAGIKKMETLMGYNKEQTEHRLLETIKVQNRKH